MDGEIVACATHIVGNGSSQSGKIGKFLFVPKVLKKFYRCEFTVCVQAMVEQVCFQQQGTVIRYGWPHAQTGYAGKRLAAQTMDTHYINARTGGAWIGNAQVQCGESNRPAKLAPVNNVSTDAKRRTQ